MTGSSGLTPFDDAMLDATRQREDAEYIAELEDHIDAILEEVEYWYEKQFLYHKNIDAEYCRMKIIQLCEDRGIAHELTPVTGLNQQEQSDHE